MNNNITIKDVMSTKLLTLHPKDSIERAKQIFEQYKIRHIPICVSKKVRGILSFGDILYLESIKEDSFDTFLQAVKNNATTVEYVMTKNPYSVTSDTLLSDAIDFMLDKRVNALPVVDDGELVGLVTTHDALRAFSKYLKT